MNEIVKKNGISFGVLLGVISVISTVVIYVTNPENFVSIWVGLGIFFLNIILGIVAVSKTKKTLGGFITFKEAFTVYFITMAISSLIGITFMFILFNFIDPSIKDTIMDATIKMSVNMMQKAGLKTEDIRKSLDAMKESDNFSLLNQLKSFFVGLLIHTIIGLIVAAATKKENPNAFISSGE
jgi:hypothetical protein